MIFSIAKLFIKDHENFKDKHIREKYGTLCSILSIICNIILVIFKMSIGFIVNSVAIMADGLNNLSDVGSNLASLFGFKLANKHPDHDHPYGHGRYEYIAGLVIAFLILLVGIQSLKDSVLKIFAPEKVLFSYIAVIILIVSIFIKLWMYSFNKTVGKKIESATLKAAGQDSLNDVLSTAATLLALCLTPVTDLPVDGIIGAVVSVFVILAGIEVFKETIDPLLGLAPNKELINNIEKFILAYEKPLGIHDLMMHDYGPGRMFMTVHVEVDRCGDIMEIHEEIDEIERAIHHEFGILTTIHYDPIDIHNPILNSLKEQVLEIVKGISESYSIHDFRMVSGENKTNLIFDVLIPADDKIEHRLLKKQISDEVLKLDKRYHCVIEIDHAFV